MRRAALALLLLAGPARADCAAVGSTPVAVASVEPRLELRLADGRRLRLVGLDPAGATPGDPDLADTARASLATVIAGRTLDATLLADRPDRWGRLPAMVFLDRSVGDDATAGGLAATAVGRGLGRYLPEAAAHDCREVLLAAETRARAAALGLWHDPYYGVLAVDDRAAFAERAGTDILVEGRLRRVDRGPFRTKLRFAAPGEAREGLLTAVVLPKVVKRFEERDVHFEALIGRTLRFRGLLDLRFGPQIEVAGPDALELLPDAGAASSDTPATRSVP